MLLIVNDSPPIANPSPYSIQRALSVVFDVVLLDSQVPEQGYLRSGLLDEDQFDLEYITPTVYERVERPVSLGELVRILQAFAGGADWRAATRWEAVDQEPPYVDSAVMHPPAFQNILRSAEYPRRGRRSTNRDEMRPLNWLAVAAGMLAFPLIVAGLVALDAMYYRLDIKDFGFLITVLVLGCLAVYCYFGIIPLRRAAARWVSRLLNVTIIEKKDSPRHSREIMTNTRHSWVVAESGTGLDWLVTLLEIAIITALAFGPFGWLILFVAAVRGW